MATSRDGHKPKEKAAPARKRASRASGSGAWSAAGRSQEKPKDAPPEPSSPEPDVAAVVQIGDRKKPVRKRRDPIPGKIGRPTSMTDEVKASLLAALRSGATHEVAATYAGVGETTFYRWMERGRREQGRQDLALSAGEHFEPRPDEDIFREFREEVDAASASAAIVATTTIRTAMTDTTSPWATRVRAASWYLERRIPGFQPKEMVGLEVQGGAHPLQVEYSETEERDKDRQIVEVLLATGAIAALTGGEDEDEDEEREDGR